MARFCEGEVSNVSAELRRLGASKSSFYAYVARFRAEGVGGLYPRSRRPRTSPTAIHPAIADAVVLARKRLDDQGWDAGADQILFWLADHPHQWQPTLPTGLAAVLPSRASVNRILTSRGMVIAVPQRAPRKPKRFEHDQPNTLWQMDGFETPLTGGRTAVVLHIVDDCSRVDLALSAVASENAADVWRTFAQAAETFGLPRIVLTDNGTAFSGHRRGWTSTLEENLTALGIRPITCSVGHPQTCGKCERAHHPVQRWLSKQPTPATLHELQALLDRYRRHNNHHRRRTHLGGLTPMQRYQLGPTDGPGDQPLPDPVHITTAIVSASGVIGVASHKIGLGRTHKHKTVHVFRQGSRVTVIEGHHHLSTFTLDGHRRYQPACPHPGTLSKKS